MAVNLGARRGARNQRQKAAVAEKRKAELEASSVSGQIRQAASQPIQHCLMTRNASSFAMGTLIVVRGATPSSLTLAGFLVDTACHGVKDTFFQQMSGVEFETPMDRMALGAPMDPIDPAHARKLPRDIVAWSRKPGIEPHRDYHKLEPIFGAIDASSCDLDFQFGIVLHPRSSEAAADLDAIAYDEDDIAA